MAAAHKLLAWKDTETPLGVCHPRDNVPALGLAFLKLPRGWRIKRSVERCRIKRERERKKERTKRKDIKRLDNSTNCTNSISINSVSFRKQFDSREWKFSNRKYNLSRKQKQNREFEEKKSINANPRALQTDRNFHFPPRNSSTSINLPSLPVSKKRFNEDKRVIAISVKLGSKVNRTRSSLDPLDKSIYIQGRKRKRGTVRGDSIHKDMDKERKWRRDGGWKGWSGTKGWQEG